MVNNNYTIKPKNKSKTFLNIFFPKLELQAQMDQKGINKC